MNRDGIYRCFDVRPVLTRLFYPRCEGGGGPATGEYWPIPVADGVQLGCLWFDGGVQAPTILFFHGNGEIAADYADVGPLLNGRGISLLVAEYRGYGRSGGSPTVAAMMADARTVFEALEGRRAGRGEIMVMGRSLGSAPAVELARMLGWPRVSGLVLESGFARAKPLLRTLGVGEGELAKIDSPGLDNVDKIKAYPGPTLVIHGAQDHLVPVGDGQALYQASAAAHKDLLVVPRADHNSLFLYGLDAYLDAVERLVKASPLAR
ncbi:MAG: alpha/beta hydrolase [Deferrisomatales bacterium]|nr:alpha/beta hydrolase [Deferrisomatales bacterium]